MDVGGSQELGGFEKKTFVWQYDPNRPPRPSPSPPVASVSIYNPTVYNWASFGTICTLSSSLPRTSRLCGRNGTCRPCDCGILLENGKSPSSPWPTLQGRKE